MSDSVKDVGAVIERHLNEISRLFVPGMKLTFLARLPGNDGADMLLTIDDPKEIIKAIKRRCGFDEVSPQ